MLSKKGHKFEVKKILNGYFSKKKKNNKPVALVLD